MKLKKIAIAGVILGSWTLSSCGGNGGEPLTAASIATVLGTFSTQFNSLPRSNTSLPTLPAGAVATPLNLIAVGCETVEPASPTDLDGDNLVTYKKYTYNCVNDDDGTNLSTYKGTTEIRDLDETGPNKMGLFGGLRVDFNIPKYENIEKQTGSKYEYSHVGYWDYKNVDGVLTSDSSYSGKNKYKSANYENDYTYTYTWKYALTPDDVSSPMDSGKLNLKGTFELNGKFVNEVNGVHKQVEGSWVIEYYTKDLLFQYDGNCSKFYKSGSMFIQDGNGTFEIRYACNTAKFYMNGVESDLWNP